MRKVRGTNMKMRSAIVVGATGLVGSSLVEQLCANDDYVSVTVIARTAPTFRHDKLTVKVRDFAHLEERDIDFAHELYCCLGTTRKKAGSKQAFENVDFAYPLHIASLAKKRGIPHFLVITAMGAKEGSPFYYNRVKGLLEKELIELELPQLSIIRPSLLLGKRTEFRLGERLGAFFAKLISPLLFGPLKNFKAITGSQVAEAMIYIALYENKQHVAVYKSGQLAVMHLPEENEEEEDDDDFSRESLFNLSKLDNIKDDVPNHKK